MMKRYTVRELEVLAATNRASVRWERGRRPALDAVVYVVVLDENEDENDNGEVYAPLGGGDFELVGRCEPSAF